MTPRETNIRWLKDILEHLTASQQKLEWTEDPESVRLVTETMLRDLERCKRVCEALRQRAASRQAV